MQADLDASLGLEPGRPREAAWRIRLLCRALAATCLIVAVTLPATILLMWMFQDGETLYRAALSDPSAQISAHVPHDLALWQRLAGAALTLIPAAITAVGLLRARRCFRLFAAGTYFDPEVVRGLRGFAGMTAVSVALGLLMRAPASAVISLSNPPGERFVTLGLASGDLRDLFFAGMVWAIAAVMAKAVVLARENAAFV
ncbi:DUF2975 domain-containing protein [Afifella sp. H1R]|uniref:DUF2975 domain-containing protein n=1 Tax=Afifella sp. H1R TaxID=2908841 RepID=UPI001F1F98CB|nr:DUF2975 domain-containing protein [Afifella sp. H1R]MCF1505578.1 DUF2975 domain-containing protein [Afifella sp. H1R]